MPMEFKVYLQAPDGLEVIRRIRVVDSNYVYLRKEICSRFSLSDEEIFSICWKDNEGDKISISSSQELEIALVENNFSLIKLYVTLQGKQARRCPPSCVILNDMLPPDVLEFDSKMNTDGTEGAVSMRPLVNGASLHKMIGRPVTLLGNVISVNPKGTSFDLKTSDMQIVVVSMRKPLTEPVSGLVEVQGIVQGRNSMVCDYYMAYPATYNESYDQELANKVITIMHSLPNAWVDD